MINPDSDVYCAMKMFRRCVVCNRPYFGRNELCWKCIKDKVKSPATGILWNASLEDVERLKNGTDDVVPCPRCRNMMALEGYDRALRHGFDNVCGKCRLHVNRRNGKIHTDVWY
jgi:hypothetical protein